jgi:hypothetical protein
LSLAKIYGVEQFFCIKRGEKIDKKKVNIKTKTKHAKIMNRNEKINILCIAYSKSNLNLKCLFSMSFRLFDYEPILRNSSFQRLSFE